MAIDKLLDKYLSPKKEKLDEASGAGTSLEIMGNTFWNKRANLIYVRNKEVLFSNSPDFPIGAPMDEEQRRNAQSLGYVLIDW